MNMTELDKWKEAIKYHHNALNDVMAERIKLKEELSNHLKEYFDYDDIQFNNDFSKVVLRFKYNHDPIIRQGSLDKLGLDFIINQDYSEELGHGIMIEVYPYGLFNKEEGD